MRGSVELYVDLDALENNLRETKRAVGPGVEVAAVVKANAYGLGAVECGRAFLDAGAALLAVARAEEAFELRRALPGAPILVMGRSADEDLPLLADRDIAATVFEEAQAALLSAAARSSGKKAVAHLKIDTGMNRLGLRVLDAVGAEAAADFAVRAASLGGLDLEGAFTHLALVDGPTDELQFSRFRSFLDACARRGLRFRREHVCDSIGLVRYPAYRLGLVRAGAVLYGMAAMRPPAGFDLDLRFAASLKARTTRVADLAEGEGVGYDFTWRAPAGGARVATVSAGYADGYPRRMAGKAWASLRGVRVPVVGLVCMDQLNIDVSAVPGAAPGDEVSLLGDGIGVLELADWAGTNRNEILSAVGRRVPRTYLRGGRPAVRVDYLAPEGPSA